jgi:hypothetical protein
LLRLDLESALSLKNDWKWSPAQTAQIGTYCEAGMFTRR